MPNINRTRWRRVPRATRLGWFIVHEASTADGALLVRAIRRHRDGTWLVRVNVLRPDPEPLEDGSTPVHLVHTREFAVQHLHRSALS